MCLASLSETLCLMNASYQITPSAPFHTVDLPFRTVDGKRLGRIDKNVEIYTRKLKDNTTNEKGSSSNDGGIDGHGECECTEGEASRHV